MRWTAFRRKKWVYPWDTSFQIPPTFYLSLCPIIYIACSLVADGVVAIFGPGSKYTSSIVASVCHNMGVPHIIAHWQPEELVPSAAAQHHAHTRNFFPDATLFARTLAEVIVDNEWTAGFTLIYEHEDSLQRLQDVLQVHGPHDSPVTVRQLERDAVDHQSLLKEVYLSGETHIVLDCSPAKLAEVLRQAAGVKMMQEYQTYLITAMDSHLLNFADLNLAAGEPVRANISTLRMMNPHSFEVQTAVHDWRQGGSRMNGSTFPSADRVRV